MSKMYCADTYQGHKTKWFFGPIFSKLMALSCRITPYNRLLCSLANCVPIDMNYHRYPGQPITLAHITSSSRFPDFSSVDMAKCVGIKTGYSKMRGDYKYSSKWVEIAWGLRGDERIIYTLCGAGVGLPTQGFVEWGAPHTIPTQGFPSGDCVGWICVGELDRGV